MIECVIPDGMAFVDYFFENIRIFFNVVANAEKSGFGIVLF